jgi:hypothetical protein
VAFIDEMFQVSVVTFIDEMPWNAQGENEKNHDSYLSGRVVDCLLNETQMNY